MGEIPGLDMPLPGPLAKHVELSLLPLPASGVCLVKSVSAGLNLGRELTDRNKNPPAMGDFLVWEIISKFVQIYIIRYVVISYLECLIAFVCSIFLITAE